MYSWNPIRFFTDLKFGLELENDHKINFVDIIIHNKNSKILKSPIYWKSTITDNIICTIQFLPTPVNTHMQPSGF